MNKILRTVLYVGFIAYCMLLLYLLLFSRKASPYQMTFWEYFRHSVNLIPFHTIAEYVDALRTGAVNYRTSIQNLVGNFVLFMPMGVFLPAIFNALKNFLKYLLTVILIILSVEIFQIVFQVGTMDIDDLILNLAGSACVYGIYKCVILHLSKGVENID